MAMNEQQWQMFNELTAQSGLPEEPVDLQPQHLPIPEVVIPDDMFTPADLLEAVQIAAQLRLIDDPAYKRAIEFVGAVLCSGTPQSVVRSLPVHEENGMLYLELVFPSSDEPL